VASVPSEAARRVSADGDRSIVGSSFLVGWLSRFYLGIMTKPLIKSFLKIDPREILNLLH
jgi:hypothetical protein